MNFLTELKSVGNSQHATAGLYAGILGLALSDLIPTPADAFYFDRERKLRDRWKSGEITTDLYWEKNGSNYYLYNAAWWVLVGLAVVYTKGSVEDKLITMAGLIGAGAVVGVIVTNIHKDRLQLQNSKSDT